MKKIFISIILLALFIVSAQAQNNNLHIVKHNDTLWDLSKNHYKNPFLWGKIWMNNTYINNPDLIFPGEIIEYTKHGITIYQPKIKKIVEPKQTEMFEKFDSAVWFDGGRYYSDCGGGFCIWNKNDFKVGNLTYDRYNHIEAVVGTNVYIKTKKPVHTKKFYVYRKTIDRMDVSICPNEPKDMYYPIAEIKIIKTIKPNLYKGKIIKATSEVSSKDVVSLVYPYKSIPKKQSFVKLDNLPVLPVSIKSFSLTTSIGYYMFFKVPKPYWQIKKRPNGHGYHIIKSPAPFIKNIVGHEVFLDRVNYNIPENTNIGEGVVVAQYKNYISIFFSTYNSNLIEMVDRTKEYVLR